ncbi:MAG: class I SAM-dependent methyltransferase [Anaerolineales bacterium]|nr:class I SAM-dependent methyltransferase [Anaerolineales bacterium]
MQNNVEAYKALLEHVKCNLCGADDYEVVYPPRYEDAKPEEIANTFRSSGDEVLLDQLVRCKQCGLMYLTPRLRADVVIDGYSAGTDEMFVSQAAGRERTFAGSLKLIERMRPQRGTLLDVGTAGGSFMAVAQRAGWQVAGCEPNRWMSSWAKEHYGLDVFPGTIEDMQLADASFDVVSLWDVLEHTPDPKATLRECIRVLKPGGLLVVNYPDIHSLVARLMGRRWVFLLSVHLYYFTIPTLTRLLNELGLELRVQRAHWQSLELGYVLFRMEAYLRPIARAAGWVVKRLGMQHWQIPYWMGQMLVVAEKK